MHNDTWVQGMKSFTFIRMLSIIIQRGSFTGALSTSKVACYLSSINSSSAWGGRLVSNAVIDETLLDETTKITSNKKQEKLDTNPPRGTRDFYPKDMRLRTWLFDHWHAVAKTYGFSQYDAPVLESESLFTRKTGTEVTQQLYNFIDKGNRSVTLRPEMTPSLSRMVMARKGGISLPLKWYSIPQCWRYERTTRGRRREHFQWNMDIWGVNGVEAEAELLDILVTFFKNVGLTSNDVGIKINSRLVIGEILTELGIPEEKFAPTCVLIDKLERVTLNEIQDDLGELGIDSLAVDKLTSVLTNNSIEAIASVLGPDSEAVKQLNHLFTLCRAYCIEDWIVFDPSVVRGLAYYTGVVFEAFDRKGQLRAIAGGGRYDKLLETFGGEPTPATGFGFGDAVIVELLKECNALPIFENSGVEIIVFALSSDLYNATIDVATRLRQAGQSVDLVLEYKKAKWIFKHADRIGCRYVVIMAPEEYANGEVSIKTMKTGEQRSIRIEELSKWVKKEMV